MNEHSILAEVYEVILERQRTMPPDSYVAKLLSQGIDRIAKKVGEEATEVVIAAKNRSREEIAFEVADLWFHSLVLLAATGVPLEDVWAQLAARRGKRREQSGEDR
jgi:phosphoribosyl-ATP pyrophosphohydrolase/phosphoribosyl-AMP cyclohydrolase